MLRRYRLTVTLEHERRRAIARIDIPWRCKTEISTLISNVIIGSTLKLPFLLLVDQFYTSKWIIFTLVATADQVCILENQIIRKPLTHSKATKQLKQASGKKIIFYTGLCLFDSESRKYNARCELFTVYFLHLTDTQIENYLTKEQPYQCAGAFMSEGLGIILFEKLVGRDPNTLIGLPLISLINMLRAHGINPLNYTSFARTYKALKIAKIMFYPQDVRYHKIYFNFNILCFNWQFF